MLPEVSTITIENAFKGLGLSSDHAKVYYSSLLIGPTGASTLAKRSNLPRSSTYDILSILVKRGLMSVVEESKTKTFTAVSPQVVLDLLKKEKETISSSFNDFEEKLEEMQNLYFAFKGKFPKVRFYEGESGLKTVLYDCLNSSETIYGICQGAEVSIKSVKDEPQYLKDFFNELRTRKLKMKDLLEENKVNREFKKKYENEYYQALLIPKRSKRIGHVDKHIYDNKVAYLSHDNRIGVIIEDETISEHEKMIFEDLWNFYRGLKN